ncbi:MAG: di-heme oxidoredictase family protein [Rhizobiaceae bacterium]
MNRTFLNVRLAALVLLILPSMAVSQEAEWMERTKAIGAIETLPSGQLNKEELDRLIQVGEELFVAKFTTTDGLGRPAATQAILPTKVRYEQATALARISGPDAQACVSCHNDPLPGGAGGFVTNVFVSEGFTNASFDTSDPQFSNERGTNHLFGAGLIELLAREMSADLAVLREQALREAKSSGEPVKVRLATKGVKFGTITALPDGLVDLSGIDGIDSDLVVRPFSQKGVMTSLRQFTVNAMNHHHGMQATERFGTRWTGEDDFDEDGRIDELSAADISALVAWQATLPAPEKKKPGIPAWQAAAKTGQELFSEWTCSECHIPSLPVDSLKFSDPGPYDVSGTLDQTQVKEVARYDLELLDWAKNLPRDDKGRVLVPLFGDLKRHKMTDRRIAALGNELLSQRFVGRDVFMTSELWGVGSTAPYGHRNDFSTLDQIILAHGGAGRKSRDAYENASPDDRSALIAFLRTLVIEK